MTPAFALELAAGMINITLMVLGPILAVVLVVGLLISLFQAVTQINEMTLSFIPKFIALFAVMIIAGPWMLAMLTDYMSRTLTGIVHVLN